MIGTIAFEAFGNKAISSFPDFGELPILPKALGIIGGFCGGLCGIFIAEGMMKTLSSLF